MQLMPKKPPIDVPGEGFDPQKVENLPAGKLNPAVFKRIKKHGSPSALSLAQKIKAGDMVSLAQGITLVESNKAEDRISAKELITECISSNNSAVRIGISGSPGVGKSSFIEAIGLLLAEKNHKVAVLAIDPSSSITGGSILGDKTRMQQLSTHNNAFIRPSPAGKTLGGVARYTRETIILCEAAGFDTIIIETVGVGQSEIMVESMVDLFVLLIQPGAGDELQGIKRGVVEMADIVIVNKADGDKLHAVKQAQAAYFQALHLFPAKSHSQEVPVMTCSSTELIGIEEAWVAMMKLLDYFKANSYFNQRREAQVLYWFHESIKNNILDVFNQYPSVKADISSLENDIVQHKISPFDAADIVLNKFFEILKSK